MSAYVLVLHIAIIYTAMPKKGTKYANKSTVSNFLNDFTLV